MDVFAEINKMSAAEILRRVDLPRAKNGKSFVCPLCDNGATGDPRHGHGDGIKSRNARGFVRWKCFKCGQDFSNFDLAAAHFGLANYDAAEQAKRLKEIFGLGDENENFSFSRENKSARASKNVAIEIATAAEKKSASEKEPKNYETSGFYKFCREYLKKYLAEHGGSIRGLTAATCEEFGLGLHPKFGVGDAEKQPHLIIPYDDCHFFARAIEGSERSQHGQNAGLYEPLPIDTDTDKPYSVNFIVESEIDALSVVHTVGHLGIRSIATGGASKYKKVVTELEKRFGNSESKPSFVVMFDNDEAGKTNGENLVAELRAAKYPAELFFLEPRLKGIYCAVSTGEEYEVPKVDANDLLQRDVYALGRRLIEGLEETENKILSQKETMKMSALMERNQREQNQIKLLNEQGIKISSFAGYFSQDFFGDIEKTAKYSSRKTGFEQIDSAQIFLPGVYVLGALPATGKTTFAWQLLNQLAEKGEPCIYCSYEMSRAELFTKSVARELFKRYPVDSEKLNWTSANIRRGALRGKEELKNLAATFGQSSINLFVAEMSSQNVTELIKYLREIVAACGDKSPVICIDYLQIIPGKDGNSAKEKVDDIMLRLKDFQRATDATLIVISSFNRESYVKAASFSSFKESGSIEYSADVIWGLENYVDGANGENDMERAAKMSREKVRQIKFSCLKNRNGGLYECKFSYHAAHDYFEDYKEKAARRSYEH